MTQILSLAALCMIVSTVSGHTALTYPRARYVNYDFLDNIRTESPCGGQLKGPYMSELKAGDDITVTWHLSYPHRGGYRIELMHGNDVSTAVKLFPSGADMWGGSDDTTATSQTVTIPMGTAVGEDWTIRLLRQALEWGENYIFWTCADVKVTSTPSAYCSGHGVFTGGACTCDSLYYGDRCHLWNECNSDSDCLNGGECADTWALYSPRRQCFCEQGFFGETCSQMSSVSSFDAVELETYTQREMSDTYNLYYKIVGDEIEFVMQAETNNWVGVGWKPTDVLASSCLTGLDGSSSSEGESGSEESTSEPGPEPTPEAGPEPTPEAGPEPTPEAGPEPTPVVAPESVNITTHVMYLASQGIHMSHMTYVCEPGVGGTEVNPEPEVTPETIPVAESETTPEPETLPEAETAGTGHPMDCTDMVIGAVRGTKSRIFDYFSRDRSTPKRDSFYGGSNSLTAALGKEEDGVTTVLFRRKLTGEDMSLDYDILDADMLVIWAFGQQHFKYNHAPATGIEHCTVSEIFFYRKDVLMYHGHRGQRGAATINFQASSAQKSGSLINGGRSLTWTVSEDSVQFTFTATLGTSQWAAFGVSSNTGMSQTDVLLIGVNSNGEASFSDRWSPSYSRPAVDADALPNSFTLSYENGVATLIVDRPRDTTSTNDMSLSDCRHLILVNGGGFDGTTYSKHNTGNPYVSKDAVCFFNSFSSGNNIVSWTVGLTSVQFTFAAELSDGDWAAVGISNGRSMVNTDVLLVGVDGTAVFSDRWSSGFSRPSVDGDNGAESTVSLTYANGIATLSLDRPKEANSANDISLTDCRYIMIASGNGYNTNGNFNKHPSGNPLVSSSKFCFNSLVHGDFTLMWTTSAASVKFVFKTSLSNGEWAAFGLSDNRFMANTDVLHVGVDGGSVTFSDRWAGSYSRPSVDADAGAESTVATSIDNGMVTLTVDRPKAANSADDISLGGCHYVILTSGANYQASTGTFSRHSSPPFVSSNQICFN